MNQIKQWWNNDLSIGVKIVFLTLLANGLPAFLILMSVPSMTEILFVWTINPKINARLIGVMYSNALLLVGFGAFQTKWANVRINMVVITLFSILATVLTFFYLKPFLAHPWYHLAFWLTMYLILFFAAPYVFITHEKKFGGRLPVQIPLNTAARFVARHLNPDQPGQQPGSALPNRDCQPGLAMESSPIGRRTNRRAPYYTYRRIRLGAVGWRLAAGASDILAGPTHWPAAHAPAVDPPGRPSS